MTLSTNGRYWSIWDLFLRCGTAELVDAEIDGVEVVPDFPRVAIGAGQMAIGRLLRLGLAGRADQPGPVDVLEREVSPGDVVAIASGGHDIAVMGSRLGVRALASGAVGVVTDGKFRDRGDLSRLPLTAWANGTTPVAGGLPGTYQRIHEPSALFGVNWHDGDWYAQDGDGALRIAEPALDPIVARFGRSFVN